MLVTLNMLNTCNHLHLSCHRRNSTFHFPLNNNWLTFSKLFLNLPQCFLLFYCLNITSTKLSNSYSHRFGKIELLGQKESCLGRLEMKQTNSKGMPDFISFTSSNITLSFDSAKFLQMLTYDPEDKAAPSRNF